MDMEWEILDRQRVLWYNLYEVINMITMTCINCGNKFQTYQCQINRGGGKYCSGSCRRVYLNKTNNPSWKCETREKISLNHADVSGTNNPMYGRKGENSPNYKDGRSKFNGRTYRKIKLASDSIRECVVCGEDDINKLDVHHYDGNRKDNDLKNLLWLCKDCHRTHAHEILRDGKGKIIGIKLKEVDKC